MQGKSGTRIKLTHKMNTINKSIPGLNISTFFHQESLFISHYRITLVLLSFLYIFVSFLSFSEISNLDKQTPSPLNACLLKNPISTNNIHLTPGLHSFSPSLLFLSSLLIGATNLLSSSSHAACEEVKRRERGKKETKRENWNDLV